MVSPVPVERNQKQQRQVIKTGDIDPSLYLFCQAVIKGTIKPFSIGNPFNGGVSIVDKKRARNIVRRFEEHQKKNLPLGESILQ